MSNIEQRIIENEIEKSLGNDFSIEKAFDILDIVKGKRAQLGEIREWRGGRFRRTANGWERIKEGGSGTQKTNNNTSKIEDVPDVNRTQYENIISDKSDHPSIHTLTIDGKEWKVNREIDRSGGQWTPYYVFEGGDGKKYWDLNAGIRAHRSSKKKTSDFAKLNSAKTQKDVDNFWSKILTLNRENGGKNLAGEVLPSIEEFGYRNLEGGLTLRGETFIIINKDSDKNITMLPRQDGLIIKTKDKREVLHTSEFKTIEDFKKKFDETVLKIAGKEEKPTDSLPTKEQLENAKNGSTINIVYFQTGNPAISYTKKNGQWFVENSMTRGEVKSTPEQMMRTLEGYNRKLYVRKMNLLSDSKETKSEQVKQEKEEVA